ncbi:MAG: hypothetical protein V2I63_09120 [Pseudomonadales bacterium]|jgi:hypothetical protein|nr:hypothetical protein [Pseudomonadales bacterium]
MTPFPGPTLIGALILLAAAGAFAAPSAERAEPRGAILSGAESLQASSETQRSPARQRRIDRRLRKGEAALAAGRLTTPAGDSALDHFRSALELGPGDLQATLGISRIVEALVDRAIRAAEGGDRSDAEALLAMATEVDATHPSLAAGRTRVARLRVASTPVERIALDPDALAARDPALVARLEALGTRAKRSDALVIIRAPRDDWSRWIYQQMNAAPPEVRLRARSEIGQPPGLELTTP